MRKLVLSGVLLLSAWGGAGMAAVPAALFKPVTIDVALSPRAAARIAAGHVPIIVAAYFEGDPTPAHAGDADDTTGSIDLGTERVALRGPGPAIVTGHVVPAAHLAWIKPGTMQVTINVFIEGARNLLNCDPLIAGSTRQLSGRRLAEKCRLIGE